MNRPQKLATALFTSMLALTLSGCPHHHRDHYPPPPDQGHHDDHHDDHHNDVHNDHQPGPPDSH